MEFIMDMVHHNPGEPPCETVFLKPGKLKSCGYNAQVFKHINTAVSFHDFDPELFDDDPQAKEWIEKSAKRIREEEIAPAKAEGLKVYYHIDLFVLPKALKEKYSDKICDGRGRISLDKELTLEIHRAMLCEMFREFDIDGLIIRVGETYLHDTPYHTGNGAVEYGDTVKEKQDFIKLLSFLRSEVCQKHGKYLFFRTWDCFPDRFHADLQYYLDVTGKIETHPKLIFSIKHTALDFWRNVKFNPCLTEGKHRQIIEVQCQREYEGKGAYPSYVMNGVINSFRENKTPKGLRDIKDHPLICGIYSWSRGGGWFGPYIKNEFWCDLNTYVIAQFAKNPEKTEEEIFYEYTSRIMGLEKTEAVKFRALCLSVPEAVLRGRYISDFDRQYCESIMPSQNWMRDDRIGGLNQLRPAFDFLYKRDLLNDAVYEKKISLMLWRDIKEQFESITFADKAQQEAIGKSIDYAIGLFNVIYRGWAAMAEGYRAEKTGRPDKPALAGLIGDYDRAWENYRDTYGGFSTMYRDEYLNEPGIGHTINCFRKML